MMYIYQNPDWHKFTWNGEKVQKLLFDIKKAQGYLLGKMDTLGFEVKNNAYMQVLTENIIKSSEIEGEILDRHSVCRSCWTMDIQHDINIRYCAFGEKLL